MDFFSIKETNSRPKLIYVENASEIIKNLIKKEQNKKEEIWEKLQNIASEIDSQKGKNTLFFEIGITNEDNKRIQMRTFREAEQEVLQILNTHHKPQTNRYNKSLWENEIEKAIERGVRFKAIYPEKVGLPKKIVKIIKNNPKDFLVKRIDTDFIRCDIIDGKKVLLKIVQPDVMKFGGILFIENQKFAKHLKNIFNEIWE